MAKKFHLTDNGDQLLCGRTKPPRRMGMSAANENNRHTICKACWDIAHKDKL